MNFLKVSLPGSLFLQVVRSQRTRMKNFFSSRWQHLDYLETLEVEFFEKLRPFEFFRASLFEAANADASAVAQDVVINCGWGLKITFHEKGPKLKSLDWITIES